MNKHEQVGMDSTRPIDISSTRLLATGRIGEFSVSALYPTDMLKVDARARPIEPSLEEITDQWLEEHREAMSRLAEL